LGENAMGLYMGGRQIFESPQDVHFLIREAEENKLNKQIMDKLLIQIDVSVIVILQSRARKIEKGLS
jgi:hypothetical protein